MITVELQQCPEGQQTYQMAATLSVADDGTHRVLDPDSLFPFYLHVLVVDEQEQLRQVTFDEDPASWARNLHTLFRSGHTVAVVTRDDAAPVSGH